MASLFRIRLVVLAVVFATLTPFVLERMWAVKTRTDDRIAEFNAQLISSMDRIEDQFGDLRAQVDSIVTTISMMPTLRFVAPATCSDMMRRLLESRPNIGRISLISPTGRIVCSSDPNALDVDVSDRAYFQSSMNTTNTVWSDFFQSRVTAGVIMQAARSMSGPDGVDYVVAVAIQAETVRDIVMRQFPTPPDHVLLLDRTGQILLHNRSGAGDNSFPSEVVVRATLVDHGLTEEDSFGRRNMIGVLRLPGTESRVMFISPLLSIYKSASQAFVGSIGLLLFETALIVITIMLLLEWFLLRGLRNMIVVAERISGGDQSARVDARMPLPELKVLAETINSMIERLGSAALHDAMTGLPNRRLLDQHMERNLEQLRFLSVPFTVAMIDVDNFKSFNDLYGHVAGDDALRRISERLTEAVGPEVGLAARYGGEEFCLVLEEGDCQQVAARLDRLRRAIEGMAIPHAASPAGVVTVSIGFAKALSGDSEASLFERADAALYRAKRYGRNRVECHEAEQAPVTEVLPQPSRMIVSG